jgi:hypothetical protein
MRHALTLIACLLVASAAIARDSMFGPAPQAADSGIAGILLYDPPSTLSILGQHPPKTPVEGSPKLYGLPARELTYLNASRTEQLVLYLPPGAMNLTVSEARVAPARGEHPVFPGEPASFVTSRSIKLGMSQAEIISILGAPTSSSPDELQYRIEREAALEWLAEFDFPYYSASYRFRDGRLVSFVFGFALPSLPAA